jgi:hypothetical protein
VQVIDYTREDFTALLLWPWFALTTLSEVPEVFRYFGEGRHAGKVVITVDADGRN